MHSATSPSIPTDEITTSTPTSNMASEKSDVEQRDFAGANHSPSVKSKEDTQTLEDVELGHRATYINTGAAAGLPQEHRDYLLARHGTLELDPIPDIGDQDPYNWPQWKVRRRSAILEVELHANKVV